MQEEERLLLTQSIRAERAIEDAEDKLRALPLNAFMEQYGEQIEELWAKRACTKPPTGSLPSLRPNTNLRRSGWNSASGYRPGMDTEGALALSLSASEREEVRRISAAFAGYDRRMEALFIEQRGAQRSAAANRRAGSQAACARWSGDKRHLP